MSILDSPVCNGLPITIDISFSLGDAQPIAGPEMCHDYGWQERCPSIPTLDISCIEDLINALMGKDKCPMKKMEAVEKKDADDEPNKQTNPDTNKKEINTDKKNKSPFDKDEEDDKDEQRDNS